MSRERVPVRDVEARSTLPSGAAHAARDWSPRLHHRAGGFGGVRIHTDAAAAQMAHVLQAEEGKVKGVVYKTPVDAGRAGETVVHSRPSFVQQRMGLPALEP